MVLGSLLLQRSDLVALSGYKQPAAIKRWLQANGFVFVVGIDGWPRVAASQYEQRMNGSVATAAGRRDAPNRKALEELQSAKTQRKSA